MMFKYTKLKCERVFAARQQYTNDDHWCWISFSLIFHFNSFRFFRVWLLRWKWKSHWVMCDSRGQNERNDDLRFKQRQQPHHIELYAMVMYARAQMLISWNLWWWWRWCIHPYGDLTMERLIVTVRFMLH